MAAVTHIDAPLLAPVKPLAAEAILSSPDVSASIGSGTGGGALTVLNVLMKQCLALHADDKLALANDVLDDICHLLHIPVTPLGTYQAASVAAAGDCAASSAIPAEPATHALSSSSASPQRTCTLPLVNVAAPVTASSSSSPPVLAPPSSHCHLQPLSLADLHSPEVQQFLQWFKVNPLIGSMREDLSAIQRAVHTIQDDAGWTKIVDDEDLQTLFREEVGTPNVSIKVRGLVDSNIFNILALINEVDLIGSFIPRIEAATLKQVSRFRQLVHTRVKLLWPVEDRDMLLEGHGVDLLERGFVAILAKSYDESVPIPADTVRASSASVSIPPAAANSSADQARLSSASVTAHAPAGATGHQAAVHPHQHQHQPLHAHPHLRHDISSPPHVSSALSETKSATIHSDHRQPAASSSAAAPSHAHTSQQHPADQLMHASAQPSPWHDVPYRPPARGVTRVHIHLGGGIIRPVSPDRTHVSMVVNVDPKLAYIPSALQNFVAKHLAAWGFQLFRHQAKKLKGSEHERRIAQKRDVYGAIEQRLQQFFGADYRAPLSEQ